MLMHRRWMVYRTRGNFAETKLYNLLSDSVIFVEFDVLTAINQIFKAGCFDSVIYLYNVISSLIKFVSK